MNVITKVFHLLSLKGKMRSLDDLAVAAASQHSCGPQPLTSIIYPRLACSGPHPTQFAASGRGKTNTWFQPGDPATLHSEAQWLATQLARQLAGSSDNLFSAHSGSQWHMPHSTPSLETEGLDGDINPGPCISSRALCQPSYSNPLLSLIQNVRIF